MSTVVKTKKVGRPKISTEDKKYRIATYVTGDILDALQNEIKQGNATTLSNAIHLILKKHFDIK